MRKTFNKEKGLLVLGMLSGFVSIIFSVIIFCMDNGSWENSLQYGGDAYTGIQNAAAKTANNIQALCDVLKIGFGALLLVAGIVIVCCFALKIKSMDLSQDFSDDVEINMNDLLEAPVQEPIITEEFFETEEIPVPEDEM